MTTRQKLSGRRVLLWPAYFILRPLADFIYPPFCLLCDSRLAADENQMCEHCWHSLPRNSVPLKTTDALQLRSTTYFDTTYALFDYTDSVQKVMHLMKYRGASKLADRMGRELARLLAVEKVMDIEMLVPVPLHPTRLRERGFNQAELIARKVSDAHDIPLVRALRRIRYTKQQAKYSREQRLLNVKEAFRLVKKIELKGKKIALVDDVLTTGSTMNECAKQLKSAGAAEVVALTIVRI